MAFRTLTRLIFTQENPNNDYVSWDIGKEPTSPRYEYENLTERDYRLIIQAKTQLDEMVHQAVSEYINDDELCNDDDDMFPQRSLLTGRYYVSEVSYRLEDAVLRGSVLTYFTEIFCAGVVTSPEELDYLGLEVHFVIDGNHVVPMGIDSSSI